MKKSEKYKNVNAEIMAVIAGETSLTARMATMACLLHHQFEHFFWTGFYCVDPLKRDELVIGPYQGSLGCLRIPFGKGVCGASAKARQTLIVDDVHNFPGHIACDHRSNSEIVVPVIDNNKLIAVLDIDSTMLAAFDHDDKIWLERICTELVSRA